MSKRTQIYELAVATAKASLQETDPIAISAATVKAAQEHKVAPEDWNDFKRYVQSSRATYQVLARQPLASESAAARAKQQADANAARQPAAPTPAAAKTQ